MSHSDTPACPPPPQSDDDTPATTGSSNGQNNPDLVSDVAQATDAPCTACSWTPERQSHCSYHSNIKLFYSASNRGVWSVGNRIVIKERGVKPPCLEARNIRFLEKNTTIPIPKIVTEWSEGNRYFMVNERLGSESLESAWPKMSSDERHRVAKQTADYLGQLRALQSPRIESVDGGPAYSSFLFPGDYGAPYGPLSTDEELWAEFAKGLEKVPEKAVRRLQKQMPVSTPYTFTHGDLAIVNVTVENGNFVGIIDWESSGYLPVWWEFTAAGIGLSDDDTDWKAMLRSYMPDFTKAREFWKNYYFLMRYPDLNEQAAEFLAVAEASE